MRKITRYIFALALTAACAVPLSAQDSIEPEGRDAVAMHFSSWYRDPEALAFGGVSLPCIPEGNAWGAAGAFVFAPADEDLRMTGFGASAGTRIGNSLGIGVSFMQEGGTSYEWDGAGGGGPYTQERHRIIGVEAGYATGRFVLDGLVKVLQQNFESNEPWTGIAAADFMALMSIRKSFSVMTGVENLGFSKVMSDSGESFSIPTSLLAGAGYVYSTGSMEIEGRLAARAWLYGAYAVSGGAGLFYKGMAGIRAGFNHGSDTPVPDFFSFGAGARFGRFRLDAAYLLGKEMADGSVSLMAKITF